MIVTNKMLLEKYKNYSNKYSKLKSEIKKQNLIRIVRGLYETDINTPSYLLASSICKPSYLSFDFALYYYGMIPEKVVNCTSATVNKRKHKKYVTPFGTYFYYDVPKSVYSIGIRIEKKDEYIYMIASPEKALCDKIYTLKPMKNLEEVEKLLFMDLRIDREELLKLDLELIKEIELNYHSTNVTLLYKLMRRLKNKRNT